MKTLWLLWLCLVLPAVLGQAGFGRSYLKNSRLCHQWSCINNRLGLPDSLPSKQQSELVLRRVLPEGPWQDVVGKVLDNCYENRTRRFTNTCPGQALLHCVVDQMIDFCPVASWRQNDSCSPVTSLAGLKYMFSQSRYENLEKNLPRERRPTWFLKNYFDSKCCDLPVIFNRTELQECGFTSVMNYFDHGPKYTDVQTVDFENVTSTPASTTPASDRDTPKTDITNPLDCCEMTNFIQPSWMSECDFHLRWEGQDRLVVSSPSHPTEAPTTTTERTDQVKDLMLLPHSCEKETCVFRKQGIINETGVFDIDAYMKMLLNFTNAHPTWVKAQGRVLTKCLIKPVTRNYDAGCEINNILSCTLDVLTENCPYRRKSNVCKHTQRHAAGCQISSSKYRPKNRREVCLLPELIHRDHLSECGLESLYRVEHVAAPSQTRKQGWLTTRYTCKESKAPTTCMMNKMGVLNKYNFMDYFKMKDRIRQFTTSQAEWAALLDIYMSAFINIPMYGEHCNSERKWLNVIDAMIMTCPISKRKNTTQCNKIFTDMTNTSPFDKQNVKKEKLDEILKHYHHVFMPTQPLPTKPDRVIRRHSRKTVKKPVYQFGFLNSKDTPPVKIINVKPQPSTHRPLILRPVYLRPKFGHGPVNDGIFRSNLFSLHDPRTNTQAPFSTTNAARAPIAHTIPPIHNNLYTTRPTTPEPIFTQSITSTDFPIEMLKPE